MNRRTVLRGAGLGAVAGLAGCLDSLAGGESTPSPPGEYTYTKDLLPESTDVWTRTRTYPLPEVRMDIEVGHGAEFENAAGTVYKVEVARWKSPSAAEGKGLDHYSDWKAAVTSGKFTFAANGTDPKTARKLLAKSPALTKSYVEDNA